MKAMWGLWGWVSSGEMEGLWWEASPGRCSTDNRWKQPRLPSTHWREPKNSFWGAVRESQADVVSHPEDWSLEGQNWKKKAAWKSGKENILRRVWPAGPSADTAGKIIILEQRSHKAFKDLSREKLESFNELSYKKCFWCQTQEKHRKWKIHEDVTVSEVKMELTTTTTPPFIHKIETT